MSLWAADEAAVAGRLTGLSHLRGCSGWPAEMAELAEAAEAAEAEVC